MWLQIIRLLTEVGPALVTGLVEACRAGDADIAAERARLVAETVAFKRGLRAIRNRQR